MPKTVAVRFEGKAETRCRCGRVHSPETFAGLRLKGWVGFGWHNGQAMAVELRDCSCGSTIGMECVAPKRKRRLNAELKAQAAA